MERQLYQVALDRLLTQVASWEKGASAGPAKLGPITLRAYRQHTHEMVVNAHTTVHLPFFANAAVDEKPR